ncbi:MAG: beta-ketoacyl-[acyl-carrier-protein] synthase family protein, partial [Bacteroidia bacterium]|nr:beta-ketoacyl-[acyl-carrier-protein] synthase family protein [Bacteroidia bacterium]
MNHRVVITGMGIYSCIGKNLDEVKDSLYKGKSGIILEEARRDFGYRSCLTGMVDLPDLKSFLSRRERVGMGQPAMYAYMSTREALANANLDVDFLEKNETGIIFGNDSTAGAVTETVDKARLKKDNTLIGSGDIFQNMNCTVNMNLSTIYKLKGVNFTLS